MDQYYFDNPESNVPDGTLEAAVHAAAEHDQRLQENQQKREEEQAALDKVIGQFLHSMAAAGNPGATRLTYSVETPGFLGRVKMQRQTILGWVLFSSSGDGWTEGPEAYWLSTEGDFYFDKVARVSKVEGSASQERVVLWLGAILHKYRVPVIDKPPVD